MSRVPSTLHLACVPLDNAKLSDTLTHTPDFVKHYCHAIMMPACTS